jgi:hypothetical protein
MARGISFFITMVREHRAASSCLPNPSSGGVLVGFWLDYVGVNLKLLRTPNRNALSVTLADTRIGNSC